MSRSWQRLQGAAAWNAVAVVCLAAAACLSPAERSSTSSVGRKATAVEGVATGETVSDARFAYAIGGLEGPESVRYDADQDVFFVSNIAGYGSFKDNNGYISRFSAANPTTPVTFIQGGVNGVTLHAPKGLAIHGDTLWVADIDMLRAFDRRSGAPLGSIDFTAQGAVLLNDIVVGPDETLRVTDTGILMIPPGVKHVGPDRIFKVGPGRAVSVVAEGSQLRLPNGITWDATGKRWIVVSFDPFVGEVSVMTEGDTARKVIWSGAARLDGVEVLPEGSIVFTSWGDSSLHLVGPAGKQTLIRNVPEPADIGIDTRRRRVAIPLSTLGQVQVWSLGPAKAVTVAQGKEPSSP